MNQNLSVIEIFKSVQGETSYAGLPCAFVRVAGCNLNCSYCDTRYASEEPGIEIPLNEVARRLHSMETSLVCITGGEPLLQAAVAPLAQELLDLGHTILVETNGTQDISALPVGVVRVMDVKCPGSGEGDSVLLSNLNALLPGDEVKFVLTAREDFDWAAHFVAHNGLIGRCKVLFSPAHGILSGAELAGWLLDSRLQARLQLQLHKILWPGCSRGI